MQAKDCKTFRIISNGFEAVRIKASLLSYGINLTKKLLANFGPPYLEKRRAYGNQDPTSLQRKCIPQEIYIDSFNQIVSAVNVRLDSPWCLTYDRKNFLIQYKKDEPIKVSFPLRPGFYDKTISTGQQISQIITLYGGKTLGIFACRSCSFANANIPCHYCSLIHNKNEYDNFENTVKPSQINDALKIVLENCPTEINQVMINGGNFVDLDKNFEYYVKLAKVAQEAINKANKQVALHLIVSPPNNLYLIELLKNMNICIAMNTEVFNEFLFNKYCPGKASAFGQKHVFESLKKTVEVIGKGNVYSIVLGGLEPHDSLVNGLHYLAKIGVTPIINIFHADPETQLANHPVASTEAIIKMGKSLQNVYKENSFMVPFYSYCGRNSIDTEAYLNLF